MSGRGSDDYAKMRARKLAEMGYVAFAADIYGKGVRPKTPQEAAAQAGIYKKDRALMRARTAAGLEVLRSNDRSAIPSGWRPSAIVSAAPACWNSPAAAPNSPAW